MTEILGQLARSGLLLPDMSAAILAGNAPPLDGLVMHLIIGALDAHAVTIGDPESSWTQKREARMTLAVAFLAAMAILSSPQQLTRS